MKRRIKEHGKIIIQYTLSLLMILNMLGIGAIPYAAPEHSHSPFTAEASDEDMLRCFICDEYKAESEICPGTADNSMTRHCEDCCGGGTDDCDICFTHYDWAGDICPDCGACDDCIEQEFGIEHHCVECGKCLYDEDRCLAGGDDHCASCCEGRNDHCALCATITNDNGQVCGACGVCMECAEEEGGFTSPNHECLGCGDCLINAEECEINGLYDHCVDCCTCCSVCFEYDPDNINEEATEALGEFICNGCVESDHTCQHGISEFSSDYEEHLCPECGTCDNEICPYCELCTECCENSSDYCAEHDMCMEDPDHEEFVCPDCGDCDAPICDDCGLCEECCYDITYDLSPTAADDGVCVEDPAFLDYYCYDCQQEIDQESGECGCTDERCDHTSTTIAIYSADENYHIDVCDDCGSELRHTKTAHTAAAPVVTTPSTPTSDGVRTISCTVCAHVIKTESFPHVEDHSHSWSADWTKDKTHHWKTCTVTNCQEVSSKDIHTFGADGLCTVCGAEKVNSFMIYKTSDPFEIPSGHTYGELTTEEKTGSFRVYANISGLTYEWSVNGEDIGENTSSISHLFTSAQFSALFVPSGESESDCSMKTVVSVKVTDTDTGDTQTVTIPVFVTHSGELSYNQLDAADPDVTSYHSVTCADCGEIVSTERHDYGVQNIHYACVDCGFARAPRITTQPKSVLVDNAGVSTYKFSIYAEGSELTYQWYDRNGPMVDSSGSISGATTSELFITVDPAKICDETITTYDMYKDNGIYCVVVDSVGQSTQSRAASLEIDHAANLQWSFDDFHHWEVCGYCLEEVSTPKDHTFDMVTIYDEDGKNTGTFYRVCLSCPFNEDVLGYPPREGTESDNPTASPSNCKWYDDFGRHSLGNYNDETHHWKQCGHCTYTTDKEIHNMSELERTPGHHAGFVTYVSSCSDCSHVEVTTDTTERYLQVNISFKGTSAPNETIFLQYGDGADSHQGYMLPVPNPGAVLAAGGTNIKTTGADSYISTSHSSFDEPDPDKDYLVFYVDGLMSNGYSVVDIELTYRQMLKVVIDDGMFDIPGAVIDGMQEIGKQSVVYLDIDDKIFIDNNINRANDDEDITEIITGWNTSNSTLATIGKAADGEGEDYYYVTAKAAATPGFDTVIISPTYGTKNSDGTITSTEYGKITYKNGDNILKTFYAPDIIKPFHLVLDHDLISDNQTLARLFEGWTDGITVYKPGTIIRFSSSNITLQPVIRDLTPISNYSVRFDDGVSDSSVFGLPINAIRTSGTEYIIPTTPPTREGYEFKGYSTNDFTGSVETFDPGYKFNVTKTIEFTAIWEATGKAINNLASVNQEDILVGQLPAPTVTYNGKQNGAHPTFSYRIAGSSDPFVATEPTTVGDYEVKATSAETISVMGKEVIGYFTIYSAGSNLQTLAFKDTSITKTYGDFTPFINPLFGNKTAVTYEAVKVSGDGAVATVDATTGEVTVVSAGVVTIKATAAAGEVEGVNYAASTKSYTLTVNQKEITLKADNIIAKVGDATPTPTYTATGLVGSDALLTEPTLNFSVLPDMTAAGSYDILIVGGTVNSNYIITDRIEGTLSVVTETIVSPVYHNIAVETLGFGTIYPDGGADGNLAVLSGADVTFIITPGAGYYLSDVIVDGTSVGTPTAYIFPAVSSGHSIRAIFAPIGTVTEPTDTETPPDEGDEQTPPPTDTGDGDGETPPPTDTGDGDGTPPATTTPSVDDDGNITVIPPADIPDEIFIGDTKVDQSDILIADDNTVTLRSSVFESLDDGEHTIRFVYADKSYESTVIVESGVPTTVSPFTEVAESGGISPLLIAIIFAALIAIFIVIILIKRQKKEETEQV